MTKGLLAERAREIEALLDEVLPLLMLGQYPSMKLCATLSWGRQAPPGYHGSSACESVGRGKQA